MKRVVIISGGSRGLGQGIAEALLANGHQVATFSRSQSEFVTQSLAKHPSDFYWEKIDARDGAGLQSFVKKVYKKFGAVHGLVNNAGINVDQLISMTSDEEIDQLLEINLKSSIKLTRNVSRVMMRQREGSIISISSIIGQRGFKGTTLYAATKSALDGMTRAAARELGGRNIRVNSIAPGFLETDMTEEIPKGQRDQILRRTPLGRFGDVSEVCGLVLFLLGPKAAFLTGQTIVVDGGLTC